MKTLEERTNGISRMARARRARECVLTHPFFPNAPQDDDALTTDGGALANFIGETLSKAAPGKSRAILFGSRARGDARPDSDWDGLILLDKDRITRSDMDEVSYPVCEFGWDADMMVNPIMYTIRDWDARRGTPFYKNVMRDGIPLWTGDYDDAYDISEEDVLPFVEPTGQFIDTVP